MAGLTSTTIAGSYERLLILPAGGLNGANLVAITDGDTDTACSLSVSTNKAKISGSLEITTSPLSFDGAATIDTSGNNLLTLQGATAGVRLDDMIGIDTAPNANYGLTISRTASPSNHYRGLSVAETITLGSAKSADGLNIQSNYTLYNTGTHGNVTGIRLGGFNATESTNSAITNLANLMIEAAPSYSGTASDVTNGPYAIFVDSGVCRFDDKVGIATGSPGGLLTVYAGNQTAHTNAASGLFISNGTGANCVAQVGFGPNGNTNPTAYYGYLQTDSGNSTTGALVLGTRADSASDNLPTERMRITSAGNVGIGCDPSAHLHVEKLDIAGSSAGYKGITSNHQVDSETSSDGSYYGVYSVMEINNSGVDADNCIGGYFVGGSAESDNGSVNLMGTYSIVSMAEGDWDNLYGSRILVDVNAGDIDANVYGTHIDVDLESAANITGNTHAIQIDLDDDAGDNDTKGIYLNLLSGVQWGIYQDEGGSGTFKVSGGGTISASNTTVQSIDYAEYFESKDGKAIAIGKTVKLDNGKIVPCEDGDTPIGVVRPKDAPGITLGEASFGWNQKFEKDDYDAKIMESYTRTKWIEEITKEEYLAGGKDETGGSLGGNVKDEKVEGSEAVEAVIRQKEVDKDIEEEVTTTELVDGKYVQKTEAVTKTVKVPQYEEVDLYDKDGEVIGKHQVPIMETVEEAVDAVAATYFRKHKYHSDRIPEGLTVPEDAVVDSIKDKRRKLNSDYDASKESGYKSRAERDEWNLIGLLGQIPVTKGQPTSSNWIKMKDVSDTVEMYFVK